MCMYQVDFDQLVRDGYEALPTWVKDKISNVALLIEDEPSKAERKLQNLDDSETLLGLYKGVPLSARGDNYGIGTTLPDTITIYKVPTLEMAEEECGANPGKEFFEQKVRDIVKETVWHEIAHHFGMNEAEVRRKEIHKYHH